MTSIDDRRSVTLWLGTWGECIANLDFARARTLFAPEVVGFGTWSDLLSGIDDLETRQWRKVWPTISDFRFDLDSIWMDVSPDRRLGHAAAAWSSTGLDRDGRPFTRPGRCTVTLRRSGGAAPWLGTHTHFSLNRGTPPVSYRDPASS
ncbi:MAG: nuclear transport factor 2 family protein [Immundisolibacterales bacterium]|nr:nuclear transport factor 2 family protein [Immundisolibacterales bacterium]